jgi:hypothetical protein
VLEYLRILHGSFNAVIMFLFFFQGWLGLTIRRAKRSKAQFPVAAVRRHRRMGPVLAFLGGLGFAVGLALALLDKGRVFIYPLHLLVGLAIVLLLISTFLVSRKIKGLDSPLRTPHFFLGICILLLYVTQSFLGLGVLF